VFDQNWKECRRFSVTSTGCRQGLESTDMRYCQKERLSPSSADIEVDLQGGIFRTFDVYLGFFDVFAIQASPQKGARNEDFSPATAYVGQLDQNFVLLAVFPVVRNQGEDFWRGLIRDGKGVLDRPNHAEHLRRVTFENVDLKNETVSHSELVDCPPSSLLHLVFIPSRRNPTGLWSQYSIGCQHTSRVKRTVHRKGYRAASFWPHVRVDRWTGSDRDRIHRH